jgi:uncharacterized protein YgiM (DUF1202 family)
MTKSPVRIAACAAIFALVPAACAMAKPITVTGDTNLRTSPATTSAVLAMIPKGTLIEVGKCSNGWCQTSYNGQDGYAIAVNLGIARPHRAPRPPPYDGEEIVDEGPVVYGPPPMSQGRRSITATGPSSGFTAGGAGDGGGSNCHPRRAHPGGNRTSKAAP